MKHWTNVCVEGHCFGGEDKNGNNPCGGDIPSPFCLGDGIVGICPHFAWSDTTERQVAHYPPLRFILWDRVVVWVTETAYWKLRWWFWDCLWFNQRKTREFFESIPIATAENSPTVAKIEREDRKHQEKFVKWLPKARKANEAQ